MATVTFHFENGDYRHISANTGDNLLEVARGANVAIDAPCSGNGACGKCRVLIEEGSVDSFRSSHISEDDYEKGWRLACGSHIGTEDVTVMVPDIASAYQSRIKTADLTDEKEIRVFEATQENMKETSGNRLCAWRLRHAPPQ